MGIHLGRIIVLVKDILDFEEIKSWSSDIKLNYKGRKTKINDLDKNALQAALDLKKDHDCEVVTLSVGGSQTRTAILEALAMGADGAYIINDDNLREADQYVTSKVIQAAIEKIGNYDLIICGELALDTLSSQIGARLATLLEIPLLSYVKELKIGDGYVKALKEYEDTDESVESPLPCLVTVVREINEPSIPSLIRILRAKKKPTTEWSLNEVGLNPDILKELRVVTTNFDIPTVERKRIIIDGKSTEDVVTKLLQYLKKERVGVL